MPEGIRIFLNERGHELPPGSRVVDALRELVPDLLPACEAGVAIVTDGRGVPVALDAPLAAGAILRATRSSRRTASGTTGDAGG